MATPLSNLTGSARALLLMTAEWDQGDEDHSTPQDVLNFNEAEAFAFGDGNNQVDLMAHASASLAANAYTDLDLQSIKVSDGSTGSFDKIKAILIHHGGTVGDDEMLEIGGSGTTDFSAIFGSATDKSIIMPDGILFIVAPGTGFTVDGTHKILRIKHDNGGSTAVIYHFACIGLSS